MSGNSLYELEFWKEEVECMPKDQLVEFQNKQIVETNLLERAYKSSLYKKKIDENNIDITKIKNREDLKQIPILTGFDIKEALKGDIEDYMCTDNVRLWFSTSGTTGVPKWIPYSDDEILTIEETLKRTLVMWNQDFKASNKKPFRGFYY